MACASLTIKCRKGEIRVFGGNRVEVRMMAEKYSKMTKEEFITLHRGR